MSSVYQVNAPIDVNANKPPLTGMQVTTLAELTTEGSKRSYQHKVVWVISERGYFYLTAGDGTIATQWQPIVTSGILEYQKIPYARGVAVILNNRVFVTLVAVNENEDPINTPAKWLPISEMRFNRQDFIDATELEIVSGYSHPDVRVFNKDNEEVSVIVTVVAGLIKLDMYPALTGYVIIKE